MYFEKRASKKAKNGFTWTVVFNYEDENGITQRYKKGGFNTKKEAQDFGQRKEIELKENGGYLYKNEKTFNEIFLDNIK